MSIRRVVPNITSDRMEESRAFYTGLLGFEVAMDMDWILTLVSPDNPTAQLSLVRGEAAGEPGPSVTLTVEVDNVDDVHARALSDGHPVIYPLTDEAWGVRRFHVRDPNGVIVNVVSHLRPRA